MRPTILKEYRKITAQYIILVISQYYRITNINCTKTCEFEVAVFYITAGRGYFTELFNGWS